MKSNDQTWPDPKKKKKIIVEYILNRHIKC